MPDDRRARQWWDAGRAPHRHRGAPHDRRDRVGDSEHPDRRDRPDDPGRAGRAGHPGRRPGWRPGRAPPWWPEGEPWPPQRGPGGREWATFGRRAGRKLFVALLVLLGAPVALGLLIASQVGGNAGVLSVAVVWLVVAVVLGGAVAVLWRMWTPIRRLIAAAGQLADGDYDTRVDTEGPVLTRPVLASFNRMAARLQDADEQRRRLLADVGHELRTPLTVLRGDLEAMVDGVRPIDEAHLRHLLDDVAVVERLLDDLRTLSLAESGALVLHREATDLAATVRDATDRLRGIATTNEVDVDVDVDDGVPPIDIDPVRIHQVVSNLVVNAIGATPAGGSVRLAVRAEPSAVVVDVADTGGGIPPDEVGRVFERFHTGSGSSGTGLGLTISRDLVAAHGGSLEIADTSPAGTTVRMTLPRP